MAIRIHRAKAARKGKRRSNAEGLIELLHEIGPRHDLANAIESVYNERHNGASTKPRGRAKRRPSTRT